MNSLFGKARQWLTETLNNTQRLARLVMQLLVLVIGVGIAFGIYYYWDRYVKLGDQSPIELNVNQLEEAVREDPQDPGRRMALAEMYLSQDRYEDALAQAEAVLSAFPDQDRAYLIAGVANVRMENYQDALEPLLQFADIRSQADTAGSDRLLETAYYFLGESYLALDQPEQAIEVLEKAIVIDRTDADALYQLGVAYTRIGEPRKALQYLDRSVRLVPDFVESYTAMIEAYDQLGESDYVAYARGMQAFSLKDYSTALTHLKVAAEALPEFEPVHAGLGLAYEQLGQYAEALGAIEYALSLEPSDLVAQQARGRLTTILEQEQQQDQNNEG